MPNKVTFGLSKLYYAPITVSTTGADVYGTPKALPGAVSMTASPNGEQSVFEADNRDYFTVVSNGGYDISLELAEIPQDFLKDALGITVSTTNKLEVESANAQFGRFALLGQFNGDVHNKRWCFYNCEVSARPEFAGETSKAKEPKTKSLSILAKPRIADDICKVSSTEATGTSVYEAWFTSVTEP